MKEIGITQGIQDKTPLTVTNFSHQLLLVIMIFMVPLNTKF